MKVKCIHKAGSKIPDEVLAVVDTPETIYHVGYGQVYVVYAILLWKGILHYLILSEVTHSSHWYPAKLFEVTDSRLPTKWHFGFVTNDQAIWGYPELILDDAKHYWDMLEREPWVLDVFNKRRAEIDLESS